MATKFKIYGLELWDEIYDGHLWWHTKMREEPFYFKGHNALGISEKAIRFATESGVEKFIVHCGDRTHDIRTPSKKTLRQKVKEGLYEDRESKFEGALPIRIYYFIINPQ